MTPDADIWRTAAGLIQEHGAEAKREAVKMANLMLDHGDRVAQVEWLRIWTAIVLLGAEAALPTEVGP